MPHYTIKSVTRRDEWSSQYGQMVDYAITLQEREGFVKWSKKVTSPPPVVGESIEGDIVQDNRGNDKFKKAYTPNGGGASSYSGGGSKREYTPRDDAAIKAQWAIGRAVDFYRDLDVFPETKIEEAAKLLYAMVERIKEDPMDSVTSDGRSELPPVGNYDTVPVEVPEGQIDLSEIPF